MLIGESFIGKWGRRINQRIWEKKSFHTESIRRLNVLTEGAMAIAAKSLFQNLTYRVEKDDCLRKR